MRHFVCFSLEMGHLLFNIPPHSFEAVRCNCASDCRNEPYCMILISKIQPIKFLTNTPKFPPLPRLCGIA